MTILSCYLNGSFAWAMVWDRNQPPPRNAEGCTYVID